MLWRVVQTCLVDHAITGGSFPCLRVDTAQGLERGYAVLRAPFERLHVIITPTVRTIGIEDLRLKAPDAPNYFADAWAVRREDGSWLMDGLIPVPEIKDRLEIKDLPEEDRGRYNTLAGMIMLLLGRLPRTTDAVEWGDWRFEVVDLDGKRVDKVLVSRNTSPGEQP